MIPSRVLKKQFKVQLLMCSIVYDDVTDFDVREFNKISKNQCLESETSVFFQIKKIIH